MDKNKQNRLEIVQNTFTAFAENNIQAALANFTEDVEFRIGLPEELPIGGQFHGHQDIQKFFVNHKQLFHMEWEEHYEQIIQENKVVILGRERAHIMPHGKLYEADFVLVFIFRDHKISKFYAFGDGVALLKAYRGE